MLCWFSMLLLILNVHCEGQDEITPSWTLEGQEDRMMSLTILNSTGNVSHHCLGVEVEGTAQVLTTCSCLGQVLGGRLVKPNITIKIHPNPTFLGWGNEETNSSEFEYSPECQPRIHIAFPWASDLATVRANGSFLQTVEENIEESWISGFKTCSNEVRWSFQPSEGTSRTCYTYSTDGPFRQLYSDMVYLIPPTECEMTLCERYPDLCDVNLRRQGILCTTLPRSFNDCLPVGSPLFCGSSVFGLSVRPLGATSACDKTWPILLFQSVVPEAERSGLIPARENTCREKHVRGFSLNPTNEEERHLLIIFNVIFTLLYKRFRA